MRTYYIEDSKGIILGYYSRLKEAKEHLSMLGKARIVCLSGPYKYEGAHLYQMIRVNAGDKNKYKRFPIHEKLI